jgi:3-deoxy-D-manno-octulosonic-acid transferase
LVPFLYNIFLLFYKFGVKVAALKSEKASLWIEGRKDIFAKLQKWRSQFAADQKVIWIHCASLGEFEQGRPLIEKVHERYPSYKILLTFFSPSGYEVRKNYQQADAVFYLPMDGKGNAQKFISILRPTLVLWVKYEYWFYYLTTLKNNNIPVMLVSAVFRNSQPFFKPYGGMWKKILQSFDKIFVQNDESVSLLQTIGLAQNTTLSGDTRFDRVIDIARNSIPLPQILFDFVKNSKVIIAGSTWEEDEEELVHYCNANKEIKFIIAPHEIDGQRIEDVNKLFKNSLLFSNLTDSNSVAQVLIIDNIGMLSSLYQLGDVAYIGGGFNDRGIHNILEAAVFGKPVIFGPVYEKFSEAKQLVEIEGAYSITNALELERLLDVLMKDQDFLAKTGAICKKFVYDHGGATNKIMEYIYANRLLTN